MIKTLTVKTIHALPLLIAFLLGSIISFTFSQVFAHGGDSLLIHSCVNNSTGAIRIVGNNNNCNGSEDPLDWNEKNSPGLGGFVNNLTGAFLENGDYRYRNFKDRDFTGAGFFNSLMHGANLTNTNFTNATLSSATLTGAKLNNSILIGASFDGTQMQDADLTSTNFTGTPVQLLAAQNANFQSANLSNVSFIDSDLTGAQNMSTSTLTGVTWSNTICPDGTNSDNNGNTCIGHLNP